MKINADLTFFARIDTEHRYSQRSLEDLTYTKVYDHLEENDYLKSFRYVVRK